MYCNVCDSAISMAANYCINPNIKALFLPRYTYTKVPDFLGSCLISRLPDSGVTENKSLLLRLTGSRLLPGFNEIPDSRFLLSTNLFLFRLSPKWRFNLE